MLDSTNAKPQMIKDTSKRAINIVFAVMISCVVLLGGYSVYQVRELNQRTEDIYSHPFVVSNALRDISINIISMRSNMQDIPFADKAAIDEIVIQMQAKEANVLASFDVVLGAFLGDKKEIEKTRNMFIQWHEIRDAIVSVARQGEREKAHAQTHGFGLEHVASLRVRIQSHIAFANNKAQEFRKASSDLEYRTILMSVLLLLLILGITIVSFVFVSRRHRKQQQEIYRHIEEIKESEDKFRDILDAAPDGLLVVDRSGKVIISNTGAQKVFGYRQEDLVGNQIDLLIPDDMRLRHQSLIAGYFEEALARPMVEGRRLKALHKDGYLFPVTISLSPVTLQGITYTTCNIRDMTGYEQLEENFRQAQKMKSIGTLVGGIAHDFNNILAAITGATFMAQRKLGSNKYLSTIESQSLRAADIVKQLLAFARKDIRHLEVMDLSELVAESSNLFKLTASENIQFNIDICQDKLPIKGDVTQLQQVILNLVNNARDAMAHSSTPVITVSLQSCELPDALKSKSTQPVARRYASIAVSDNGHGIDQKHLKKIFEPFFTQKEVGKGTGLGLAMVKGTIESHGGVIDVESEVGEGTTFNIFLPLLDDVEVDADVDADIDLIESASGECILLVDDESALREVNREILESLGYQVEEAADGLQAVKKFNEGKGKIRLVIMDVVMPRMGGIKAAEQIRQISETVPIIFATGYDPSQVLGEYEGAFPNSLVITKPFSTNELNKAIRNLVIHE